MTLLDSLLLSEILMETRKDHDIQIAVVVAGDFQKRKTKPDETENGWMFLKEDLKIL